MKHTHFISAAALDLHSFYASTERLFELIAVEIDKSQPTTGRWHRDLLVQMGLNVVNVRPAVLSQSTHAALVDYLEFRHVVRNVYTFNLRPLRVIELIQNVRSTFGLVQLDLLAFANFLDGLSTADEDA